MAAQPAFANQIPEPGIVPLLAVGVAVGMFYTGEANIRSNRNRIFTAFLPRLSAGFFSSFFVCRVSELGKTRTLRCISRMPALQYLAKS